MADTKTVDVYTYPNRVDTNCRQETRTGSNDGVPYTYEATVCDTVLGDPVITPTNKPIPISGMAVSDRAIIRSTRRMAAIRPGFRGCLITGVPEPCYR